MPEENRQLKVFLCYASDDKAQVKALHDRLTADGVDAWLDKERLLPGQDWHYEIQKAVREADVVIVCHSKSFNQEGFRQREVRWTLDIAMEKPEGEIFVIPARLEECDILDSLKERHWVDLFEDDGYEKLMMALQVRAESIGAELRVSKGSISDIFKKPVPKRQTMPKQKTAITSKKKKVTESKPEGEPEKKNIPKAESQPAQKTDAKLKKEIIVAVIGAAATIIAGILGSPYIGKLFEPAPDPTGTATFTITSTATLPIETSMATLTPSIAPISATPVPPPLVPTLNIPLDYENPFSLSLQKISEKNINDLQPLTRVGRGAFAGFAWPPDGKTVAIASSLGVAIFSTADYEEIRFIETGVYINCVAFSPNGEIIATGSPDGTVRLWEMATGKLLGVITAFDKEYIAPVYWITFSPDGKTLASSYGWSQYQTRLWRISDGMLITAFSSYGDVKFSYDGQILAIARDDKKGIELRHVEDGELMQTLDGEFDSIDFSPDGQYLVSSSLSDNSVRLWRVSDGSLLQTFSGKIAVFSPDGKNIALADGNTVNILRTTDFSWATSFTSLKGFSGYAGSLSFSRNGQYLISIGDDNDTVTIWDVGNGTSLKKIDEFTSGVLSSTIDINKKKIASGGRDGIIRLWDMSSGNLLLKMKGHEYSVWDVDFNPGGQLLVSASGDGTARVWDTSTGTFLNKQEHELDVWAVAISHDGRTVASGDWKGKVKIWNINDGNLLRTLGPQDGKIFALDFSPNNQILASGDGVGDVWLWDYKNGALFRKIEIPRGGWGYVYDLAFSPDGKLLAIVGSSIYLYRVSDGVMLNTIDWNVDTINTIAFSPDGLLLASGSDEGTVRIWRVSDGELLSQLAGHLDEVKSVEFSKDGKILMSGSEDGSVILWGLRP